MVPALIKNRRYILTPTDVNPAPAMFPGTGIYLGMGNTPGTIRIQFEGDPNGMTVQRAWFTYDLIISHGRSRTRSRSKSRNRTRSKSRSKSRNANRPNTATA